MKTIYKLLLVSILMFVLNSCSDNDDEKNTIPIGPEIPELTIVGDEITVIVDQEEFIEIAQGGNGYNVFSLNPDIVEAKMDNEQVIVPGKSSGGTFIILSDQSGQYKKYPVISYYDKLTFDQEHIDVETSAGKPSAATVKVLKGNGNYSATSDNDELLSIEIVGNNIIITALEEGDANIIVKDSKGIEGTFSVHVTLSTNPYTEAELTEIKNNSQERYVFEGYKVELNRYNTFINTTENGMNKYGWSVWSEYLTIWFSGDKTVGKKEKALLSQFTYEDYTTQFTEEPAIFEIIKNNGTKIWAVYSVLKADKLSYGYFCAKINP